VRVESFFPVLVPVALKAGHSVAFPDVEVIDLGPDAPDYRWHADVEAESVARYVHTR
jgi:hypothetical protein